MRRRDLLAVAGALSLAGCQTQQEQQRPENTDDESTGSLFGPIDDEQVHEFYVNDDLIQFEIASYRYTDRARYYDSITDNLLFAESENGRYLRVNYGAWNLGGEPIQYPKFSYPLFADGDWYEPISGLPGETALNDIRDFYLGYGNIDSPEFEEDEHLPDQFPVLRFVTHSPLYDVPKVDSYFADLSEDLSTESDPQYLSIEIQ